MLMSPLFITIDAHAAESQKADVPREEPVLAPPPTPAPAIALASVPVSDDDELIPDDDELLEDHIVPSRDNVIPDYMRYVNIAPQINYKVKGYPKTSSVPATAPGPNMIVNPEFNMPLFQGHRKNEGWDNQELLDDGSYYTQDITYNSQKTRAIKLKPQATSDVFGYMSATQVVAVKPSKTYTLSGYIKTDDLEHGAAFFNIEQLDDDLDPVDDNRWTNNRDNRVTGKSDWTKRQITFTTEPDTNYVRIYLEVDHRSAETTGSAYFSFVKFEPGPVSTPWSRGKGTVVRHVNPYITEIVDPTGNIIKIQQFGNRLTCTDGRGHTTSYQYNDKDQLISVLPPAGPIKIMYEPSAEGAGILSRTILSPDYIYETQRIDNKFSDSDSDEEDSASAISGAVQNRYDDQKRMVRKVFTADKSGARTHDYSYNGDGHNTSVDMPNVPPRFTPPFSKVPTCKMDYDSDGRLVVSTFPNNTGTALDYDEAGRIARLRNWTLVHRQAITDEGCNFDQNSNRVAVIDNLTGQRHTYTYDALEQLISEAHPGRDTTTYAYDIFGNRISKSVGSEVTRYVNGDDNKLISVNGTPYLYDDAGRLISDGVKRYVWDEQTGRLTEIQKPAGTTLIRYGYDTLGRRISTKYNNGDVINYIYDSESNRVLFETDKDSKLRCYYTYNAHGQRLALTLEDGRRYYYHYNLHGDVVAMTDFTGKEVANYDYDAWGNTLEQSDEWMSRYNHYRYAGYRFDPESGLYYLNKRYYNPVNGVFLSQDEVLGIKEELVTQNRYVYANNNPVMFIDPNGDYAQAIAGFGTKVIITLECAAVSAAAVAASPWVAVGAVAVAAGYTGYVVYDYCTRPSAAAASSSAWSQSSAYPARPMVRSRGVVQTRTVRRATAGGAAVSRRRTGGFTASLQKRNILVTPGYIPDPRPVPIPVYKPGLLIVTRPDSVPSIKDRLLDVFPAITPSKYDAISRFILKSQKKSASEDKGVEDKEIRDLAEKVADKFGSEVTNTKKNNGYMVKFKYKGKNFEFRAMGKNSGQRNDPYFRICIRNQTSLNRDGIYSPDRAETHMDINGNSYKQILDIIEKFIKSGGKLIG